MEPRQRLRHGKSLIGGVVEICARTSEEFFLKEMFEGPKKGKECGLLLNAHINPGVKCIVITCTTCACRAQTFPVP